jgi:hypothetical protein
VIRRYSITGNCYQNISTVVNKKMFYTPKKGQTVTIEVIDELPKTLIELRDKNLIMIKEIK